MAVAGNEHTTNKARDFRNLDTDSSGSRRLRHVLYLRLGLIFFLMSYFTHNTYDHYNRLWIGNAKIKMIPKSFSGIAMNSPRFEIDATPRTFIAGYARKTAADGESISSSKAGLPGTHSLSELEPLNESTGFIAADLPELQPESSHLPHYAPDELELATRDTVKTKEIRKMPENRTENNAYFVSVYGEQGINHSLNLTNTAGLEVYDLADDEQGKGEEIDPAGTRIEHFRRYGVMGGKQFGKHLNLSAGIEVLELSGSQTYMYDVEKQVTTTVTRNVPVAGPPGSPIEYMEVEEERLKTVEIQDTLHTRFDRRMFQIPVQLRAHTALSKQWSIYASLRTALHLGTKSTVEYESSDLSLHNDSYSSTASFLQYLSMGAGAGIAYRPMEHLELTAEPAFMYMKSLKEDPHVFKERSSSASVRISCNLYF